MHKSARLPCLALAITTIAVIGLAPAAHSDLLIRVDDGTTTATIMDGTANDQCAAAGCITFGGNIGNFNINMTGASFPASSPNSPGFELNSVNVTTGDAGGTLRVLLTQTEFVSFSVLNFAGTIGGTQSGAVAAQFFMDILNTPFGETHQFGNTLNFIDPTFSGITNGLFNPAEWYRQFGWGMYTDGAFSLTEEIDVTMAAHSNTRFNASLIDPPDPTPVPEPTSMALLAGALVGLCLAERRRKTGVHRIGPRAATAGVITPLSG